MSEIEIERGNRPSVLEFSVLNSSDPIGQVIDLVKTFYNNKLKINTNYFEESLTSNILWMNINNKQNKKEYLGRVIIKNSERFKHYNIEFDIMNTGLNRKYNSERTAKEFLKYYKGYSKPN